MRPSGGAHLVLLLLLTAIGCGGSAGQDAGPPPPGPFDDVKLTQDLTAESLDGPLHVVRDEYGLLHVHATTPGDAAYGQGYMMAHDRLPQMDILRRFGAGTLAEIFGALDPSTLETDLEMRIHRMRPLAEAAWAALRTSTDPRDREIVIILEQFAAGVNAYNTALAAGTYELDPVVAVSFDPERFRPWEPVDSLVLGRFQAFALSWTAPLEIELTDIYQRALEYFEDYPNSCLDVPAEQGPCDMDRVLRHDLSSDLVRLEPVGKVATVDGFPALADSGARSSAAGPATTRPKVPQALLANARRFFARKQLKGPHAFMVPRAGSNNWVVAPQHGGGKALLAGDQHLSLPNPSIFYPIHLIVEGQFDAQGITFPGIPGIVLGHNGTIAWTSTTVFHDVNDVYCETIVPCDSGEGDCAIGPQGQVPIESWIEEVGVGALSTITETKRVTYERVPGHGPLIPTVVDGEVIARQPATQNGTTCDALSVKYTGHSVTQEIRATYGLMHAQNVEQAMTALENFEYGGQNWVVIDNGGNIGWSTHAKVPVREASAHTWQPLTNRRGLAPWMVLPGDGGGEWQGWVEKQYLPHAVNPAQGYLVTANSDPVGATFDGNPHNGPMIGEGPLYVGATYAPGFRSERIDALLRSKIELGSPITLEDMAAIQHDTRSTVGSHLQPLLQRIFTELASDDPNDRAVSTNEWLTTLSQQRRDALTRAGNYLSGWSLATPAAVSADASERDVSDSVTTTLFNVWMHFFIGESLGDEFEAMGLDVYDVNENITVRTVVTMLKDPGALASPNGNGSPNICKRMTPDIDTWGTESCDTIVLVALDRALQWLASAQAFGTDDMSTWRWGKLHTLTLEPLFPENRLHIPPPNAPDELRDGFPKPGDNFVVNRADCTYGDLDFTQDDDGPAQRFLAEVEPGGTVRARMSLPGGTVYNRDSPHYRDLLDSFYLPQRHFDLPFTTSEIVAKGEERWVFRDR